jgi:hypothetical protein
MTRITVIVGLVPIPKVNIGVRGLGRETVVPESTIVISISLKIQLIGCVRLIVTPRPALIALMIITLIVVPEVTATVRLL